MAQPRRKGAGAAAQRSSSSKSRAGKGAGAAATPPAATVREEFKETATAENVTQERASGYKPFQKVRVRATRVGFDGLKRRYPIGHGHKTDGQVFEITCDEFGRLPTWVEDAKNPPKKIEEEQEEGAGDEEGSVI